MWLCICAFFSPPLVPSASLCNPVAWPGPRTSSVLHHFQSAQAPSWSDPVLYLPASPVFIARDGRGVGFVNFCCSRWVYLTSTSLVDLPTFSSSRYSYGSCIQQICSFISQTSVLEISNTSLRSAGHGTTLRMILLTRRRPT